MKQPSRPTDPLPAALSRRERQVMEIVYRLGSVTAAEVLAELPDPPSDSAIRYVMRTLEIKGQLVHAWDGPRYVYRPTAPRAKAGKAQVRQMINTFFDGEPERLVAALIQDHHRDLDDAALARLARMIDDARRKNR